MVLAFFGHPATWLGGMLAGAAIGGWLAAGVGGALAAHSDQLEPGAGELGVLPALIAETPAQRTRAVLQGLGSSGWTVLHDVRGREATYDHIAIGSGGVIVLHSIDPGGAVSLDSGEPTVTGGPGLSGAALRLRTPALADAAAFRDELRRFGGVRAWVQAVVVVWSQLPAGSLTDGRCVYVHGSRLEEWLARRPQQLDAARADEIAAAARRLADDGACLPVSLAV
ncbi:MAG TPA: hypothetical protein VND92_02600 [Vicinamibacterales bacterium]|nr:hypothetical protein [Vicinamibacterales bacterium]